MDTLNAMLAGAILVSASVISVFFLRFWKKNRDVLFVFFAIAFLLLGIERVLIVTLLAERQAVAYLTRLCAFVLIIVAICLKNRSDRKH